MKYSVYTLLLFIIFAIQGHSQTTFQYDTKGNQTAILYSGSNPCQPSSAMVSSGNTQQENNIGLNVTAKKDSEDYKTPPSLSLNIYPNPSSNYIMIEYSLQKDNQVNIRLYDLSGQLSALILDTYLYSGTYQARFDMKDLPPGIYTCVLLSALGTESVKVVKINW